MLDLVTTTCKYVRHLLCGMCAFYCTVNNAHTFMYATEDVQVDKLGPCVHNALIVMTEYDDTDKMHNLMHSKHRNLRYLCKPKQPVWDLMNYVERSTIPQPLTMLVGRLNMSSVNCTPSPISKT